jgi:hypothetical protein
MAMGEELDRLHSTRLHLRRPCLSPDLAEQRGGTKAGLSVDAELLGRHRAGDGRRLAGTEEEKRD